MQSCLSVIINEMAKQAPTEFKIINKINAAKTHKPKKGSIEW
jgi:hypothetical protein